MRRDPVVISIGGRRIGEDVPLFAIAEIGLNHDGQVARALALVDAAAASGAHAVKLQTLTASRLVAPGCPPPAHVAADSLVDFFARFELDEDAHAAIAGRARAHGLKVISTPLSLEAVASLERVGIDAYKIASGDLTFEPLIRRAAATGKPLVLSTGMATLEEVQHALSVARAAGARDVAVLHCVSAYPVPRGSENLAAIRALRDRCGVPVGLSDHAEDTFALPMAVAMGASLYERHLVLDGDDLAVDRAVSSTPSEFAAAVHAARRAWAALGAGVKTCLGVEAVNRRASRRGLYAARPLAPGATLGEGDLIALRPATGLPPGELPVLLGRRLARAVAAGDALTLRDLEPAGAGTRPLDSLQQPEADRVA